MADTFDSAGLFSVAPDRRAQLRQSIRSLAYVDLGFGNGGIILNISEGGLAVRAVTALVEKSVPKMRFQPPTSKEWVEVGGEVAWTSESKTMVGIRFLDPAEESRTRIHDWIMLEAGPVDPSRDRPRRSFESGSAGGLAAETLPLPAKGAAAAEEAPSNTAQSVIPTHSSDLQIKDSKSLISVPSIAAIEASSSPSTFANAELPFWQKLARSRSHQKITALMAFFAVASLAVGWAVGRGKWNHAFARIQASGSSGNSAAADAAERVLGIEVVDLNDHRWIVPFNSRPSMASAPARQNAPSKSRASTEPIQNSPPTFRIWTLSPPLVSRKTSGQEPLVNAAVTAGLPPNIQASEPWPSPIGNMIPAAPVPPRVAGSGYRDGQLIRRVDPIYPSIARDLRVEGVVKLRVKITVGGAVEKVEVLSGPKLLLEAAVTAVRQWRYQPSTLNGNAIEVEKEVNVQFRVGQ